MTRQSGTRQVLCQRQERLLLSQAKSRLSCTLRSYELSVSARHCNTCVPFCVTMVKLHHQTSRKHEGRRQSKEERHKQGQKGFERVFGGDSDGMAMVTCQSAG